MVTIHPVLKLTFISLWIQITTQKSACTVSLWWAPKSSGRTVFTTFINHANCPSWATRNTFTKSPTGRSHLQLPKDTPFAFICGACYSPSNLRTNLTAHINGQGHTLDLIPLKGGPNGYEHVLDDYNVCLLSYGLTSPLKTSGDITCNLNRGKKVTKEKITFTVTKIPIKTEENNIEVQGKEKSQLECPQIEQENKQNTVYVWHYPVTSNTTAVNKDTSSIVKVVVPSLERSIYYSPRKREENIICSTYDFSNPKRVFQKSFKLIRKSSSIDDTPFKKEDIYSHEWGTDGNEFEPQKHTNSKSNYLFIIIICLVVGVIIIAPIMICVSYGLCTGNFLCCGKKERKESRRRDSQNNSLPSQDFPLLNKK